MSLLSFLNFAKQTPTEITSQNNSNGNKYINWGEDNLFPMHCLKLYDTVPENQSAIDFVEENIIGKGVDGILFDYWLVKKIVFDYITIGGYTVKIVKTRGGSFTYEYFDITKCRLSKNKDKIGYCEEWGSYKATVEWYPISDGTKEGIYLFKNIKSKRDYPRPYYLAGFKSIETLATIIDYHYNNANNGFVPNVLINVHGVPEPSVQEEYEKKMKLKFTGSEAQKFILSFNDSEETKTTIEKLNDDNLDAKFKDLQLFLRDEIIIGHKITSPNLIGVNTSGNGFSKTEYQEALDVFKSTVIQGYKNELEYSLSKLTGSTIKFLVEEMPIVNNNEVKQPVE
jgi:hypothetical protein